MNSGRGFLRIFDNLVDRILCVLGAVLFSQGPEFMQQYLQRLGGHLYEARRQLDAFEAAAARGGVALDRLISQTSASTEPSVAQLGQVMTDTVDRVAALQSAYDALLGASLWERPFVFLRHVDVAIARATGVIFQPAVPTTLEGLVYAFIGMTVFLGIYHLGLKRLLNLFRTRKPELKPDALPAPVEPAP